tara:strand:- start:387 stop:599 length:213 start_codon:yes stop_codon:yes gene_type:complete
MPSLEKDSEFKKLYNIDPSTYTAGIKNPRCNAKPIVGLRKMESNNAVIKPTLTGINNIPATPNPVMLANQ